MLSKKYLSIVALASCLAFAVGGCKKGAALGPLKDQALKLISEHSGKLAGLKGKLGPLIGKIGAIPDSIPGAAALKKLLGEKQGEITKIEGLLGAMPAKVESAVKGGKKEAVTGLLTEIKGVGSQIGGISKFVTETPGKVAELEKLAAAQASAPDTGSVLDFTKMLSTGYELKGASTGIENVLVTFLDDKKMAPAADKWFNFDRLTFASGSANLDMGKSEAQLKNMAEILKAYPKAKAKIGGYTDNTGKEEANMKISQTRADNVLKALVGLGIEKDRLSAKGYGPTNPVCAANDTAECKASNRRIAVNIEAK